MKIIQGVRLVVAVVMGLLAAFFSAAVLASGSVWNYADVIVGGGALLVGVGLLFGSSSSPRTRILVFIIAGTVLFLLGLLLVAAGGDVTDSFMRADASQSEIRAVREGMSVLRLQGFWAVGIGLVCYLVAGGIHLLGRNKRAGVVHHSS